MQRPGERIDRLLEALLERHAPQDAEVGEDNANPNFLDARHPKSFVSLDGADHLLTRTADADYAAEVIAAWSSRYLGAAPAEPGQADQGARVEETGAGRFLVRINAGGAVFLADEPIAVGGLGTGPTPYDILCAGLGACTVMTLRMYAERKGWPVAHLAAEVSHVREEGADPPDRFIRRITIEGAVDAAQRARLLEIAGRCPVHQTLERGSRIETAEAAAEAG
jgi:putative redox protein